MIGNLAAQISQFKDPFLGLRLLLSYPLCNWVAEFFLRSREYEKGLEFIGFAQSVIEHNSGLIPELESEIYDRKLITMNLVLLDYLNRWNSYIEYFDQALASKPYTIQYKKENQPAVKEKYIVAEDSRFVQVHFLYPLNERYNITCRKLARQNAGKSVEYLKRHSRAMLPEVEVNRRYTEIIDKLNWLLNN
ncbi:MULTISPECIES: hypothetical protein [unclassified Dehalobacter]|uniref:hypothetical protein n=1 Tax=unclassified Dehalobacter TaxID=2635733 RepID=UPI001045A79D|nr:MULTISPECIES: hypothetical protein [unclassified Dehalobacter]TCX51983.1 hypothetical protein C1I36_06600 [Dehalobacter sp. 14DCB1]TCX53043.1 hypothetical protein C1I38_08280 [Dehalobacter sp. 12DCB1]